MGKCGKSECCQLCTGRLDRFFSEGDEETLSYLKNHQESFFFKKGEVLFSEGSPSSGIFCILKGNIKLVKNYSKEKERIINILKPGELMGVHSSIVERDFNKSAIALDNVQVCHLPKEVLFQIIEKKPTIVIDLLRHVENGINEIQGRATQILQLPTEERLIRFLLMIHHKFSTTENGYINLSLSPKDIANILHTTRATVYRLFKKLKSTQLIAVKKNRIKLLNISKLKLIGS